jgi:hypothetical protein
MGNIPGLGRLPLWLIILLVVGFFAIQLLSPGGGDESGSEGEPGGAGPAALATRTSPTATRPPVVIQPPPASAGQADWLVMLYQDADDKILEQDIYVDLNEVERVGSTDRVQIVTQIDRFRAGFEGDGDWTSARRYYVTQDDDLQRVNSQLVAELDEVNMSDGKTLVDFVTWAVEAFPAEKYLLVLSDHGLGWPGGWSDPAPGGRDASQAPLAEQLDDQLYLMELDQALEEIRDLAGIERFELVGLDACLMGHLEVFTALAPHARFAVASQETEPALGWAYTGFLEALVRDPEMDGGALGRLIVQSYIQDDQRIVDDQARAEFLRQGSPLGGLFGSLGTMSAGQLADQLERGVTLATVDLEALPKLNRSINEFAFALQEQEDLPAVAQARNYAQSFTSIFGKEVPASYIDLGSFVQLVRRESSNPGVSEAADQVLATLQEFVVAEKHGESKSGATGVSIYFPNSALYRSPVTGAESYTTIASRFAQESLWDDYLAFHYTNRRFELAAEEGVVPQAGASQRAPGAAQFEVSPITLSDDVAAPGQPVLLSTEIQGQNIGYVYLFTGFFDRTANSIFLADLDYLESPESSEVDGVFYPQWSEDRAFILEFEWEPTLFAITDGDQSVVTPFKPERYGASAQEAVYTVDGIYTFTSGEERPARLYFRDGALWQVFGFTGTDEAAAPREILPQLGDTFTILETWMDLDANGRVVDTVSVEGATLTFGEGPFHWEEVFAAPGDYVLGFIVEDLDGNRQQVFAEVTVR